MLSDHHSRSRVLNVVDEVYSGDAGLPWGAQKTVFSALDYLRSAEGGEDDLRHLEPIAVGLHHLQALCGTAGGSSFAARATRHAIRRTTVDWLQQTRVADLA